MSDLSAMQVLSLQFSPPLSFAFLSLPLLFRENASAALSALVLVLCDGVPQAFLQQQVESEGKSGWVVQRYIDRPLLLRGDRKFDVRCWVPHLCLRLIWNLDLPCDSERPFMRCFDHGVYWRSRCFWTRTIICISTKRVCCARGLCPIQSGAAKVSLKRSTPRSKNATLQ